jgi:hypothetical protein
LNVEIFLVHGCPLTSEELVVSLPGQKRKRTEAPETFAGSLPPEGDITGFPVRDSLRFGLLRTLDPTTS